MIIISYDISDDRKRTKFSRYLEKYGHRIQYSVFEIENSDRILNNIMEDIQNRYMKVFDQKDSVYIFNLSKSCEVVRHGYAKNEESTLKIVQ